MVVGSHWDRAGVDPSAAVAYSRLDTAVDPSGVADNRRIVDSFLFDSVARFQMLVRCLVAMMSFELP